MNTINDMYGINCTDTTKSNTVVKLRILYLTMNRPVLISKVFSVKNPNIRCEMGLTKNCCTTHEYGSRGHSQKSTYNVQHIIRMYGVGT